jgi:hypothetical protein
MPRNVIEGHYEMALFILLCACALACVLIAMYLIAGIQAALMLLVAGMVISSITYVLVAHS